MRITNAHLNAVKSKTDIIVVGVFRGGATPSELSKLDPQAATVAKSVIKENRFSGKAGEVFSDFGGDYKTARELVLLGLGKKDKCTREGVRVAVSKILNVAKARNAKTVRILGESFSAKGVGSVDLAGIIPETLLLAEYRFDKYQKQGKKKPAGVTRVEVIYSTKVRGNLLDKALTRAEIVASSVIFTRNLINEPANIVNPPEMAVRARKIAKEGKMKCTVLGKEECKRKGMGGVIGVSQGSKHPPQFIVLEYGTQYKKKGTICLVGKGVTFDTGGISIKPSQNMEKMKYDMSGSAVVLGTMKAISQLKPKQHVVSITPCVENMPGSGAQRPGDIIKMMNGKTVEVINTDAEGRLILADALAYTEKYKPKAIIDLATLTGACIVALADKAVALLGTDQNLVDRIRKSGELTGERCWQLPLWDDYFEQIRGHHADINNVGGGGGGTITAAMFLKEFVPVKNWAHMDIAGTSWTDRDRPYRSRGATGIGVRTLVDVLENWK